MYKQNEFETNNARSELAENLQALKNIISGIWSEMIKPYKELAERRVK